MGFASEHGIRRFLMMVIFVMVTVSYADAGRGKCKFNGNKYKIGEEVLDLPDHCCSLKCATEGRKGIEPKHTGAMLTLEFNSLDSCTCKSPSRSVLNLTAVLSQSQLNLWGSEGKMKPKPKSGRKSKPKPKSGRKSKHGANNKNTKKFKKDNKKRAKKEGERAKKKKKGKCVFNNKKYKNNAIVEEVAGRCFDLVCQAKQRKKKGSVEVVPRTDCTCSDDAAPPAPAPAPPTPPARDCSEYAESYTPTHSICLPKNQACGIHREGVSEEEKKMILKEHNEYRAKVARGDEKRGAPGPQPSAANMREMVWNQELADVAQAWCNTCPRNHDCNDCRRAFSIDGPVGQNLYWHFSSQSDQVWSQALAAFYDEVQFVPKTLVDNFLTIPTAGQIGHYTQMVWAETSELGCGAAYHGPCAGNFPECKTYCCNYGPAGNILARPIYESGPAASNCPNGKSNDYDGLCKP